MAALLHLVRMKSECCDRTTPSVVYHTGDGPGQIDQVEDGVDVTLVKKVVL